jgi:hypothetical protein
VGAVTAAASEDECEGLKKEVAKDNCGTLNPFLGGR